MAKAVGATMWFWIFWRLKHDWRDFTVSIVKQHIPATDLQTRTWIKHLLFRMKLLAATLEGSIQNIQIPLGCAFLFHDFLYVMNDQHETEKLCSNR